MQHRGLIEDRLEATFEFRVISEGDTDERRIAETQVLEAIGTIRTLRKEIKRLQEERDHR